MHVPNQNVDILFHAIPFAKNSNERETKVVAAVLATHTHTHITRATRCEYFEWSVIVCLVHCTFVCVCVCGEVDTVAAVQVTKVEDQRPFGRTNQSVITWCVYVGGWPTE